MKPCGIVVITIEITNKKPCQIMCRLNTSTCIQYIGSLCNIVSLYECHALPTSCISQVFVNSWMQARIALSSVFYRGGKKTSALIYSVSVIARAPTTIDVCHIIRIQHTWTGTQVSINHGLILLTGGYLFADGQIMFLKSFSLVKLPNQWSIIG